MVPWWAFFILLVMFSAPFIICIIVLSGNNLNLRKELHICQNERMELRSDYKSLEYAFMMKPPEKIPSQEVPVPEELEETAQANEFIG